MKTVITQKEYNKVYDDIMKFVFSCGRKPRKEVKYFCISPKAFKDAKSSYDYNMLHKDELSLSEREYGQFIDSHYKEAIIKARCAVFNYEELERLKWDIAMAIRSHFGIGEETFLFDSFDYYDFYDGVIEKLHRRDFGHRDIHEIIEMGPDADYILSYIEQKMKKLSLGERKYGHFIDNNYKKVIAYTIINNDESEIDELQKHIAYEICRFFQNEYDRFYYDVMEYYKEGKFLQVGHLNFCNPPEPSDYIRYRIAQIENVIDNNNITELERFDDNLSLSDQEYGRFLDKHFKGAFNHAMNNYDRDYLEQIKRAAALAIKILSEMGYHDLF